MKERITSRLWSVLLLCCLFSPDVRAATTEDGKQDDIAGQLQADGVEEKTAQIIAAGLKKAEEENSLDPVVELLNGDDQQAFLTACMLAMVEDEKHSLLRALEREDLKKPGILIYAYAFTRDKGVVDYLVKRLTREKDPKATQAIVSVLRVVTEQKIADDPGEWLTWWEDKKDVFEFPEHIDIEKRERDFKIECRQLVVRQVKDVLQKAATEGRKDDKTTEKVRKTFDGIIQMLTNITEGVEKIRYSEHARKGYQFWRQGELKAAIEAFRQSTEEDAKDIHSRYMTGFLLVEAGEFAEAERVFNAIIGLEKKCEMARFLARFCQHRRKNPASDIFEALLYGWEKAELDGDIVWGWNDSILPGLMGQASLGEGPYGIDRKRLEEIATRSRRPDMAVAAGLLQERGEKIAYLESRESMHKESVMYQTALLRLYMERCGEEHLKEIMAKLETLKKLAPENGFYSLMLAYYSDYEGVVRERSTGTSAPLPEEQMRMIEAALDAKEFRTFSIEITKACIGILREAKTPFAETTGLGTGVGLLNHYAAYRSLARRLRATVEKEAKDGHGAYARSIADTIVKLGDKVDSDNGLIINHLVAEAIRGIGRAEMIKQAENAGIMTTAKKYRQLDDKAKEERKQLSRAIGAVAPLCIIPVPKIQKAILEETLKDEVGFYRRFAEKMK